MSKPEARKRFAVGLGVFRGASEEVLDPFSSGQVQAFFMRLEIHMTHDLCDSLIMGLIHVVYDLHEL